MHRVGKKVPYTVTSLFRKGCRLLLRGLERPHLREKYDQQRILSHIGWTDKDTKWKRTRQRPGDGRSSRAEIRFVVFVEFRNELRQKLNQSNWSWNETKEDA